MFNQIITQKNSSIKAISLLILLIWCTLFLSAVSARREDNTLGTKSKQAEDCVGGMAGDYPCDKVNLLAVMPLSQLGGSDGNDIWGWTDSEGGKEYAIMGRRTGTSFVDISNPEEPIYLGNLPGHNNTTSQWRDIKVYKDHAFIVSEEINHGMQIFDLTQLRNVSNPPEPFNETAHYDEFGNAHNIIINEESGFAYAVGSLFIKDCSGGLHMINIQSPTSPTFAGCFSADGYTSDAQCVNYHGPDNEHQNKEICFAANEDTLTIVDVSDKALPVQLSRTDYDGEEYANQGWLTENQQYFLLGDTQDEENNGHNTRTYIWDVSDLDNPAVIGNHTSSVPAIDHNQYIKGNYVYQANYRAGLRILELSNIANGNLSEVGYFDIYPSNDNAAPNGAWSVYPFFDSGKIIVSGMEQGLFILEANLPTITNTPIPTDTPTTPTDTPTPTGSPTYTPTHTPTSASNTPTNTPTATPTTGTPSEGDEYEDDDSCAKAKPIQPNGSTQYHTFHDQGDLDWVSFEATAGITVVLEARIPPGSTADVVLTPYEKCDGDAGLVTYDPAINRYVREFFVPPRTGTYYLKVEDDFSNYGPNSVYHLSVRTFDDTISSSAMIIVAGRKDKDDPLQKNIHYVTDKMYNFAQEHGCAQNEIKYLTTGTNLSVPIGSPTEQNLENAITQWAVEKVAANGTLTIYMMDHGANETFYLDDENKQRINPNDLNDWLTSFEKNVENAKVNVIIEACNSGSFIDLDKSISKQGRVVITSTSSRALAYAPRSQGGAVFSDIFLSELQQGSSLYSAFENAKISSSNRNSTQQPWLDDNGDYVYNADDKNEAQQRILTCDPITQKDYRPEIQEVEVLNLSSSKKGISVTAKDEDDHQEENGINKVWAVVYPPSYEPQKGDEMVSEPSATELSTTINENDWYTEYELEEEGVYRVVIHAEDKQGLLSQTKEVSMRIGYELYLPAITR